jgi:hypothetical protein
LVLPFELSELPSCRLAVRTGGIFSDPVLLVDGRPVQAAKDGTFTVLGEDAAPGKIRLLNRGLDLIPDVRVADRTVVLMKPLHWFDYAWCLLPVVMFLSPYPVCYRASSGVRDLLQPASLPHRSISVRSLRHGSYGVDHNPCALFLGSFLS